MVKTKEKKGKLSEDNVINNEDTNDDYNELLTLRKKLKKKINEQKYKKVDIKQKKGKKNVKNIKKYSQKQQQYIKQGGVKVNIKEEQQPQQIQQQPTYSIPAFQSALYSPYFSYQQPQLTQPIKTEPITQDVKITQQQQEDKDSIIGGLTSGILGGAVISALTRTLPPQHHLIYPTYAPVDNRPQQPQLLLQQPPTQTQTPLSSQPQTQTTLSSQPPTQTPLSSLTGGRTTGEQTISEFVNPIFGVFRDPSSGLQQPPIALESAQPEGFTLLPQNEGEGVFSRITNQSSNLFRNDDTRTQNIHIEPTRKRVRGRLVTTSTELDESIAQAERKRQDKLIRDAEISRAQTEASKRLQVTSLTPPSQPQPTNNQPILSLEPIGYIPPSFRPQPPDFSIENIEMKEIKSKTLQPQIMPLPSSAQTALSSTTFTQPLLQPPPPSVISHSAISTPPSASAGHTSGVPIAPTPPPLPPKPLIASQSQIRPLPSSAQTALSSTTFTRPSQSDAGFVQQHPENAPPPQSTLSSPAITEPKLYKYTAETASSPGNLPSLLEAIKSSLQSSKGSSEGSKGSKGSSKGSKGSIEGSKGSIEGISDIENIMLSNLSTNVNTEIGNQGNLNNNTTLNTNPSSSSASISNISNMITDADVSSYNILRHFNKVNGYTYHKLTVGVDTSHAKLEVKIPNYRFFNFYDKNIIRGKTFITTKYTLGIASSVRGNFSPINNVRSDNILFNVLSNFYEKLGAQLSSSISNISSLINSLVSGKIIIPNHTYFDSIDNYKLFLQWVFDYHDRNNKYIISMCANVISR